MGKSAGAEHTHALRVGPQKREDLLSVEMIGLASREESRRCKLRLRGQCHRMEVEGTSASVSLHGFISWRKSHLMGMGSLFMFSYLGQSFNYKPNLLISLS